MNGRIHLKRLPNNIVEVLIEDLDNKRSQSLFISFPQWAPLLFESIEFGDKPWLN